MAEEKIVSLADARKARERKSDAKTLVNIGRIIGTIEHEEIRTMLTDAWRKASIMFFASGPV